MITMGPKEWRLSGRMLALRGIRQYVGVGGNDAIWMRPAFADGLVFTRSVNRANGKGAILCWDLRARPQNTWVKFGVTEPVRGLPGAHNRGEAQAEVEGGRVTGLFMELPTRSSAPETVVRGFARGLPREVVPLADGRWKAEVDVEMDRDVELWSFDLDTTGAALSGTYRRTITALPTPTAVGGDSEAKQMAQTNVATHEVHLTEFTPGEKALILKGTVLFHSDPYVTPSSQRPGVVAMDVELTLNRDGESWKGVYEGVYGSPWTGRGKIVGPK